MTTADSPLGALRRPGVLAIACFLLVYALLQGLHLALRDSVWHALLIDTLTVLPAAALIDLFLSQDEVVAAGPRLRWPGGTLSLATGCDGLEVITLYVAALFAAPIDARRTAWGLLGGVLALWALNQVRVLLLYAAYRHDRDSFDALHTVWGPLLLIVPAGLIFCAVLSTPWPAAAGRPPRG